MNQLARDSSIVKRAIHSTNISASFLVKGRFTSLLNEKNEVGGELITINIPPYGFLNLKMTSMTREWSAYATNSTPNPVQ